MKREEAEKIVDENWNEIERDGKLYGYYLYQKFDQKFIDKMQSFVERGLLTEEELKKLAIDSTLIAGGLETLTMKTDTEIEKARAKIREECIEYQMKREE